MIDIGLLADYPLLLLSVRRLFNAACRITDVEVNILSENRAATHVARARRGRARNRYSPILLRTDRYFPKVARVTHRRRPCTATVMSCSGTSEAPCSTALDPMQLHWPSHCGELCGGSPWCRYGVRGPAEISLAERNSRLLLPAGAPRCSEGPFGFCVRPTIAAAGGFPHDIDGFTAASRT